MKVIIRNDADLAKAKRRLALVEKAWEKTLTAQSLSMGDDELARPNLARLESEMSDLEEAIAAYEEKGTTRRRAKRMIPV